MFRYLFGPERQSAMLQMMRPRRQTAAFDPERGMRALREAAPIEFEIMETPRGSQARPVARASVSAGPAESGANAAPCAG